MSFLVLVLLVLVEKFSRLRHAVQQDTHWLALLYRVEQGTLVPWQQLAVLILAPLLLLALVLLLLQPIAHGWLALPLDLLLLLYSLGRGDPFSAIGSFRDAFRRGDTQGAYLAAERDLDVPAADDKQSLLARVQSWLLWQAFSGWFVLIFWYALLGPIPAIAYRLLLLTEQRAEQPGLRERATLLRHALDWLPLRVLVLSFALVGNFSPVLRAVMDQLLDWEAGSEALLQQAAFAAEDLPEQASAEQGAASLDAIWQLLLRSAVLWYAGFALWLLLL
ncbi:hypothetical protein AXE65_10625 [Ventosimonas gracilis]|uniref:AmpE protein n=1 Tax=Ventosimonas gracilis TaxID=1680762 RepID=A0A139SWP5_9GAMM|nr:regulatory signaling modulator protein AmpE [Ventosimonas gracilis]KXU39045.1 hypothetical protein AXE65_10625 [Ventosimonas gracilis]